MTAPKPQVRTVGALSLNPDKFFESWAEGPKSLPEDNDLRSSIIKTFGLKNHDDYVYHATASVTLAQVQNAINFRGHGGLHAWYMDAEGKQIEPPPPADIASYVAVFSSTTSTPKALTRFLSNAKKSSLRSSIATHLLNTRLFPPSLIIPKLKTPHTNPYYDFWAWSCHNLEWAGPNENTVNVKTSHHILPVLYHHFGCVCPSYEALEVVRWACEGGKQGKGSGKQKQVKEIVEIGSGNGYWTYLLRRLGLTVTAVDNGDSEWRTVWIPDTIKADGVAYLMRMDGAKDKVLLLVYPQVGADFTGKILRAYEGDTIVVAGTQNGNGFTGFKTETITQWMEREKSDYTRIVQIALPGFAGKDEALFVFRRGGVAQDNSTASSI